MQATFSCDKTTNVMQSLVMMIHVTFAHVQVSSRLMTAAGQCNLANAQHGCVQCSLDLDGAAGLEGFASEHSGGQHACSSVPGTGVSCAACKQATLCLPDSSSELCLTRMLSLCWLLYLLIVLLLLRCDTDQTCGTPTQSNLHQ